METFDEIKTRMTKYAQSIDEFSLLKNSAEAAFCAQGIFNLLKMPDELSAFFCGDFSGAEDYKNFALQPFAAAGDEAKKEKAKFDAFFSLLRGGGEPGEIRAGASDAAEYLRLYALFFKTSPRGGKISFENLEKAGFCFNDLKSLRFPFSVLEEKE